MTSRTQELFLSLHRNLKVFEIFYQLPVVLLWRDHFGVPKPNYMIDINNFSVIEDPGTNVF